ncbi:MAG: IS200/IS605 family transposase [Chloroflexota bacterium]
MVSKAFELDAYIHAINGMPDHTHVVASIPPKHSVSNFVKRLKGASSHFVNKVLAEEFRPDCGRLDWQRGYGYFTLGQTQLERAVAYVENQRTHHTDFSTNGWLERYTDVDEGPPELYVEKNSDEKRPMRLREEVIVYNPFGELPF